MRGWSVHTASGHCRHESGFDAYVDLGDMHGDEIPLLGPFGCDAKPTPEIMLDLIDTIENCWSDRYVVLGERSDESDRTMLVMGIPVGWKANYAFRTMLLSSVGCKVDALRKEWSVDGAGSLRHRSGLFFDINESIVVSVEENSDLVGSSDMSQIAKLSYFMLCGAEGTSRPASWCSL